MNDDELTKLRAAANKAEQELADAVFESCSGPHRPYQHRDRHVPWCRTCGRTRRGVRIMPARTEKES